MKTKSNCDCRDCGEETRGKILNLLVFVIALAISGGLFILFRFWN